MRARLARCLLVACAIGLTPVLAGGCGGGGGSEATSATVRTVRYAYARSLFREMCAGCHALADAGAHGDRVDLDTTLADAPDAYKLAVSIMETGAPGMPKWSDRRPSTEIQALARYIAAVAGRATRSGDGRQATALTPLEDSAALRRNPREHGKALFKEICAGCHTLADADAHGARFDLDYNFRGGTLTKARLHWVLRGEIEMPDWTRWLTKQEIEALVEYVPAVAGKGA